MAGEWRGTVYGRFSSDFVEDCLVNLCDPINGVQTGPFGSQLHKSDYVSSGTPIITVEHLGDNRILHEDVPHVSDDDRERLSKYSLRNGDIVFSRVGSVDRRALVRKAENGWLFSGRCLRIRPDPKKIDSAYLSYFFGLPSFKEHVKAIAVGATMPSLNTQILSDIVIPHPCDLNEQRAIAHALGTLDDKIELNRRMNETLEAMARALFKSWFIDFEPVRAKMAGRDLGLPQHLADLFPDRLIDSELGPIPEGWRVTILGEHVANFDSKRVPVSKAERAKRQGPFPYHGAAGVMDHVDDYLFDGIYLLVGEDGSVSREGGLAVTQYVWGKFWVNNHAHVLQGKGPVSTEQVYLFFDFELVAPYVTGAVQPKLSQSRMNNMPFLFPGTAICRGFTKAVSPWFAGLRVCAAESKTLAALRDTLLPKLISGKLRVKDAETFLDRVL